MSGTPGLEYFELRHRLLGNLQLLQALIGIRLRSVDDPESRRHLNWLADVVTALGLINRRLGAEGLADFAGYLAESAGFWRRVCAWRGLVVALDVRPVAVPEPLAPSLAVIVHELIANAVEHAFPDGGPGRITIRMRSVGEVLELSVTDDGGGMPTVTPGEGLRLALGLADHLGGTLEITQGPGVTATLRAPLVVQPAPPAARH